MTHLLDLAIHDDAPHGDIFNAIDAINADEPNRHRVGFLVVVTRVGSPNRLRLYLEPEATPQDVCDLCDLLEAWTADGMIRTTHLTREELAA